ncbi:MAG: cytochrome c oxidase assembly protein [Pseudomonadota bacterium]|nr:MAG: cytochrome c oxidase assembly protein [Pseudomonadota bacterium]
MTQQVTNPHRRLTGKLVVIAVAMFGFGFLLVPLYSVICDTFGLNGRFIDIESGQYDAAAEAQRAQSWQQRMDTSRTITVQFMASRNQNLQWEFKPLTRSMKLHPGEVREVRYYAKNLTGRTVVAQAVPSLVPGNAVKYFSKMECFCFTQQTFQPGEGREMPLRFVVNPDLPRKIGEITLAYTFFDTGEQPQENAAPGVQVSRVDDGVVR